MHTNSHKAAPMAQRHQEMVERRRKVAAFRISGMRDQARIAKELGVSQPTISRDMDALDEQYRQAAAADTAKEKGLDLERCERLIGALWADAVKGRWLAIDRVLALMAHRAKLLGLEAPQKVNLEVYVRQMAESLGLDADAAVQEAQRIVNATRMIGRG